MSVAQEQTVLEKIKTRGYWCVSVRPTMFEKHHIRDDRSLFSIVERNSVRLRGWDYPHIDDQNPPIRKADWVGQEIDWQDEIEVWRLYMSGQFVHFFALAGEWRDHSEVWPPDREWEPGRFVYYVQTVYSFVEILEFASRLALSPAGAASMHVEIRIKGLQGRLLVEPDPAFRFGQTYTIGIPEWNYSWEGTQTELIARPRELAAEAARQFLDQFGLKLSPETLARVQAQIGR